MSLSILQLICLGLFIVMVVFGIVRKEFAASPFWFECLVGVAVLVSLGVFAR